MFLGEVSRPQFLSVENGASTVHQYAGMALQHGTTTNITFLTLARRVSSHPIDAHFPKKYKENSLNLL